MGACGLRRTWLPFAHAPFRHRSPPAMIFPAPFFASSPPGPGSLASTSAPPSVSLERGLSPCVVSHVRFEHKKNTRPSPTKQPHTTCITTRQLTHEYHDRYSYVTEEVVMQLRVVLVEFLLIPFARVPRFERVRRGQKTMNKQISYRRR